MRAFLLLAQLLFVLFLLYVTLNVMPALAAHQSFTVVSFLHGFIQMVTAMFTGNWGVGSFEIYTGPYYQLYADYVPGSIELAIFGLGISALIAYPVSLLAGWGRLPGVDASARLGTLAGALLPAFIIGTLVLFAVFFGFVNYFHDIPDNGLIPSPQWINQYYVDSPPAWLVSYTYTRPTGFPLIDAAIHGAWTFEAITFTKTLMQATVIAIAYVAIFVRHARVVVVSARQELHITAARARGLSERTLLWQHTGRRVLPTFLLIFALTIPAYIGTQCVVEGYFIDPGIGYLTLASLTQGLFEPFEAGVFLIAILVLVWTFAVDLIVYRLDPRGVGRT
jgi:peptide/nickel transport system permease protein